MSTTLEKVKQLEQYISIDSAGIDPVLDMAITKLLEREAARIRELKNRLLTQLTEFEHQYSLPSQEFYTRYEQGEMGDDMDFIEWAATIEMVNNIDSRLTVLDVASTS